MLILILLIATTAGHRVTESIEDLPPEAFKNTTTLYPVSNNTNNDSKEKTNDSREKTKINGDATTWKLETAFAESNLDKMAANNSEKERVEKDKTTKNTSEEFKPSPHLGTFFEDDSLEIIPTKATFGDFRPMKQPASEFISFPKDKFKGSLYSPKDIFRQNEFPYKIEGSIHTRAKTSWRHDDTMDSRPTIEVPMKVPAGGLYKAPVQEAFSEKPDEDFGLSLDDFKDHNSVDVKKRVNPWKSLLRLVTAFIPVGLIISALTPSIITIEPTGPDTQFPSTHQVFRRSDSSLSQLSPISEPCRRRLLCELRSDNNYTPLQQGRGRRRHCHRIHCEEPEALAKMLQWLLSHHTSTSGGT